MLNMALVPLSVFVVWERSGVTHWIFLFPFAWNFIVKLQRFLSFHMLKPIWIGDSNKNQVVERCTLSGKNHKAMWKRVQLSEGMENWGLWCSWPHGRAESSLLPCSALRCVTHRGTSSLLLCNRFPQTWGLTTSTIVFTQDSLGWPGRAWLGWLISALWHQAGLQLELKDLEFTWLAPQLGCLGYWLLSLLMTFQFLRLLSLHNFSSRVAGLLFHGHLTVPRKWNQKAGLWTPRLRSSTTSLLLPSVRQRKSTGRAQGLWEDKQAASCWEGWRGCIAACGMRGSATRVRGSGSACRMRIWTNEWSRSRV